MPCHAAQQQRAIRYCVGLAVRHSAGWQGHARSSALAVHGHIGDLAWRTRVVSPSSEGVRSTLSRAAAQCEFSSDEAPRSFGSACSTWRSKACNRQSHSLRSAAASLRTMARAGPNRRPVCAFVPALHGGVRAGMHKRPRSMRQAVQVDEQDAVLARDVAALSQQALARLHARVHHAHSPRHERSHFRVPCQGLTLPLELGARGAD
jgi:hypothetical protein